MDDGGGVLRGALLMEGSSLTVDDKQLRLLWAGAKHYRNVYADLRDGRLQTARDCMVLLEAEANTRGIRLDTRRDPVR